MFVISGYPVEKYGIADPSGFTETIGVDDLKLGAEVLGIEVEIFAKNTIEVLTKSFVQILEIFYTRK